MPYRNTPSKHVKSERAHVMSKLTVSTGSCVIMIQEPTFVLYEESQEVNGHSIVNPSIPRIGQGILSIL